MNDNQIVNTSVDILGKPYPIRCQEAEVSALQAAADFLNKKLREMYEAGKGVNLERLAIITALNLAHQFLELDEQKNNLVATVNERIEHLQEQIESKLNEGFNADLVCE